MLLLVPPPGFPRKSTSRRRAELEICANSCWVFGDLGFPPCLSPAMLQGPWHGTTCPVPTRTRYSHGEMQTWGQRFFLLSGARTGHQKVTGKRGSIPQQVQSSTRSTARWALAKLIGEGDSRLPLPCASSRYWEPGTQEPLELCSIAVALAASLSPSAFQFLENVEVHPKPRLGFSGAVNTSATLATSLLQQVHTEIT